MSKMPKAEVSLPNDKSVRVTRQFNAPRTLVYRAFTTPALIQQWLLGPPGWSMPVCEMDTRVGGKFRWRWRNDESGKEFGFYGELREVRPPEKIVHTEFFDPGDLGGDMGDGALVTTEFAESRGITTMSVTMEFSSKEARDAAMSTGMTGGMEQSYARLDEVLAKG